MPALRHRQTIHTPFQVTRRPSILEMVDFVTDTEGLDVDAHESQTVGGDTITREVYRDDAGNARVETWSIEGFRACLPNRCRWRP